MLNLLFISNNARAELLRGHFQHLLKMRVELVADFDHGLKDVFEKRPVVVCIQEQIAGVTGESVARHIQLLLGSGAPAFILLHESGSKARALPGLFDYLVDLSAPFEVVTSSLGKALQMLLSEHWEMLYVAPTEVASETKPLQGEQAAAEQLVDDFIAESSIFHPERAKPLPGAEPGGPSTFSSLLEHEVPGGPPAEPHAAAPSKQATPVVSEGAELAGKLEQPAPEPRPVIPRSSQRQVPKSVSPPHATNRARNVTLPVAAKEAGPAETDNSEVTDLLQVVEAQYRRKKYALRLTVLCLLLVVVAMVCTYFARSFKRPVPAGGQPKPHQLPIRTNSSGGSGTSAKSTQQRLSSSRTVSQPLTGLPAFIPITAPDAGFSAKHPGWKRYCSEKRDYRLFLQNEQLQAMQVLSVGSAGIPLAEVQNNLKVLTGVGQFTVDKREDKQGLVLEHARIGGHAELLVYRSRTNGPIRAFVYARQ